MDLSTAASSSSAAGVTTPSSHSSSNSHSSTSSSNGDSAVACPVCTLYLREGISLQKHLDTHPKEQVIEALIRASGSGAVTAALFGQPQQQPPAAPPTPSPAPAPSSAPAQAPAASPSPHVSHAPPSPFPIGPIYHECPPLNAMIPPAQFASFSYQQFVNNGTMMIPAQYAMAQAQPPQTSQMMQMLYNPYGMYHQQQIPTVQMISAPPMMPSSASTIPTTVPSVTTRMRPSPAASTSNVTITPVSDTTMTSLPLPLPLPLPAPTTSRPSSAQPQQVVEPPKPQQQQQIEPVPDRILPDLEEPPSPEPQQDELEDSHGELQNGCAQREEAHDVEQYHRVDPPTLLSNETTDDDKTERILPDIEDDDEIESLIVRDTSKTRNDESSAAETAEPMDTCGVEQSTEKATTESSQSDHEENHRESPSNVGDTRQTIVKASDMFNIPDKEARASSSSRPEVEKMSQLLVDEFNNVDLSSRFDETSAEKEQGEAQDDSIDDQTDKHVDEDESTSVSYHKGTPEQIECKIIVAHDESDVCSVASSDSLEGNHYSKLMHSRSAPTSPVCKKTFQHRSRSRASLRSDLGHSNENLNAYPVGFEATSLRDCLKDNYSDADMELEEPMHHHSFMEIADHNDDMNDKPKDLSTNMDSMKARRSRLVGSPVSVPSASSYCQMEDEEEDSDVDSCGSKDDEEDEDEEHMLMEAASHRTHNHHRDDKKMVHREACKAMLSVEINRQQDQSIDFRSQSIMTDNYSAAQFPLNLGPSQQQQHQPSSAVLHHETCLSNSATSHNSLNIPESADPTTSTDSKSYSSKSTMQKPSAELLNINEDAHAGPMNVFEFDGLQILVPSTFISESSQKAVSGTSQQSMSSSENGGGNDEEVKSVNMRADETMPPRGELSEQESNGCTEQSAWQLYMGQESSRMSTSYDLMARESWEESEPSDHEENNAGPLLDSRSLATHFTSSLFLDRDRDRKTPTRRVFKCAHCPDVFECPKERRVHSTMVHKESGPSSSNDNMDNPDLKEIKVLDSRTTVFDDLFVPGLHAQQIYHQQPLLHTLQPPQHNAAKVDGDSKMDGLHMPSMEVMCSLCNQRFTSEKSLQIHHRRIHDADAKRVRETTKCQICNEEFTSVASYNLHLKIHPLECGQCGKYFYRKQNFKLHMKRHLGIKPFQCTMCDKAFLTKQKLDEHTNGHTGNAPVKCNLCNETFRRYSNLTQHKNRHHLNIKKKLKDYICHCGEVFHTKKKLAWHKETHDEKPKACTYCNERFIHMASLTRHMRRAHNRRFVPDAQRDNENVECPICKCIYLKSSLAVHMRVHNGEKPYTCQICPKAFSTKWNLQLHKWTHANRNAKPFKCNQCTAAFYRHSDYTAHMNSHRNVRPYTCNYCGAQFIRKYNCLRHVKEHEENKQYTCDVCNKAFHRSYYLKEHLRVHSGQRPHSCHICGKTSSTKSNHNKHVRIHHAREPVNTEN